MKTKNIIKTIFSIMILIIAILCMTATNVQADYNVGDTVALGYTEYINNKYLYCMQHGQRLKRAKVEYQVISKINIDGTKSTDQTGKTIDNRSNAIFAYILNQDNGNGNKKDGFVANAIWQYGYKWMQNVGKYHAGLYLGFAKDKHGKTVSLTNAEKYANSISAGQNVKDNTDKSKIKVVAYNKDGKQYMRVGPFNWTFSGTLSDISIYDQNGNSISEKLYSNFNGTTENWFNASNVKSGSDFYISIPANANVTKITKVTGTSQIDTKKVEILFFKAKNSAYQNLIEIKPGSSKQNINLSFDYDISILGKLKVIKVNKDNTTVKLQGVGFYLQNKETGKYVKKASDGTISYVDSRDQATEFVTDKNGEFTVEKLIVGTYVAYETKNPNYGYEIISGGVEKTITVDKTAELQIPNKQKYIKLSGYVWVDKVSGKQSLRNDLYKDNDYDSSDILLDGIKVKLKDKSGNTIKETTTSNGGSYLFEDVLTDELDNYYIEFEYDGLTYTNVIPHNDKDNGSKAAEDSKTRDGFNNNFATVEGVTGGDNVNKENTGITRNTNGDKAYDLSYNLNKNEHAATLINNGQYSITSNTDVTGYKIKEHFTPGQEEIKNINLGLYEREQPDIALVKDLQNVNVAINGYNHVYEYAQRFNNPGEYGGDGFNVGVKFGNKYNNTKYTRAIYKSDYDFENPNDRSKELQVYLTYKIAIKNTSTNLKTKVNSIGEYYDSNYELVAAGTGIGDNNTITGNLKTSDTTIIGNYKKTIISSDEIIDSQQSSTIYVQFKLNRDAVLKILNNKDNNLNNVAEVNSYSVYDENGKTYAGIDKNSNPGNVNPEDKSTYQDDTDSAPALQLEVADARELTGTVFLDSTSDTLMTGNIRQGDGKYTDGEKGIPGVHVTLKEISGTGKEYPGETDENGNFTISGFIPGDYEVIYTWGDQTYTVQKYKGTIFNKEVHDGKEWYKKDVDTRYTDAIDNYDTRKAIDEQTKTLEKGGQVQGEIINKMDSTTPTMGIGVEYDTTTTASTGDKFTYVIKNVDFGIVERARQEIELSKSVKSFKATLANGQVIADATIENGELKGEKRNLTYMKPSDTVMPKNGSVKLELDNELIQGTTIEVTYEIKATNNSEVDYIGNDGFVDENYYKYGTVSGNEATITVLGMMDYLDQSWSYTENQNDSIWKVKSLESCKGMIEDQVYNSDSIKTKILLYTEGLKDTKLIPGDSASMNLKVSKMLANTDEISLDNEVEINKIDKDSGSKLTSTPGNYVPGTGKTESDDSTAETIIVTPSTGSNLNIILPIGVGIIALIAIGAGVIIIKKKVL